MFKPGDLIISPVQKTIGVITNRRPGLFGSFGSQHLYDVWWVGLNREETDYNEEFIRKHMIFVSESS